MTSLLSEHEGISIEGSEKQIPVTAIVEGIENSYQEIIKTLFKNLEAGKEPDIDVDKILADSAVTRSLGIRKKTRDLIEQKIEKLWDSEIVNASSLESLYETLRAKGEIPKTSSEGSRDAEEVISIIEDYNRMSTNKDGNYISKYSIGNITPSLGIRSAVIRLIRQ